MREVEGSRMYVDGLVGWTKLWSRANYLEGDYIVKTSAGKIHGDVWNPRSPCMHRNGSSHFASRHEGGDTKSNSSRIEARVHEIQELMCRIQTTALWSEFRTQQRQVALAGVMSPIVHGQVVYLIGTLNSALWALLRAIHR